MYISKPKNVMQNKLLLQSLAIRSIILNGLSVWFDTPNDLSGKEIWTVNNGNSGSNPDLRGNSDLFR